MPNQPDHVTADRADRVQAGQFVHDARPLLSEPAPDDGWEAVESVETGVQGTVITLAEGGSVFYPADRIIYLGWES